MDDLESTKDILDTKLENLKPTKKSTYGGKRDNAGMKKGTITKPRQEKLAVMRSFRERVQQHADALFNAQYDLAIGEKYLMVKRKVGTGDKSSYKTEVVTDVQIIKEYIDNPDTLNASGDDYYFITTRAPSNQALDSLLDRGLGKPTEKIEIEGGFFKADKLIIEVANERPVEPEREIIEIESEAENSS